VGGEEVDEVQRGALAGARDHHRHGQPGRDFKTWEEEKPPVGTLYNYPPRGDVIALLVGYPAPQPPNRRQSIRTASYDA
jgi:hypothetical protein